MKKFILIFSALFLALPFSVLGVASYERIPSGFTIQNPVNFNITLEVGDFEIFCETPPLKEWYNYQTWGVSVLHENGGVEVFFTDFVASTTLSNVFSINLPIQDYQEVYGVCGGSEEYPETHSGWALCLECNEEYLIFEVVETPAGANFVPISGNFITGAIAYINDMAVGIFPLLGLFIGVPLAFWFIGKVVEIPKKGLKK